jgi:5-methylcytosine-specific restriction endonuclease McrA
MTSPVPGSHVCTLEHSYHGGDLWQCRCGAFWGQVRGEQLAWAFLAPELRIRLREYRSGIRFGEFASLADAARQAADRRREQGEKERERARLDWPLRQKAKRAKWMRCVREVILRRPCAYCGGEATQLDHVIPRAHGGGDKMRNLAASCGRCNLEKGNRTPVQWKAWRLNRGRPWPPLPAAS